MRRRLLRRPRTNRRSRVGQLHHYGPRILMNRTKLPVSPTPNRMRRDPRCRELTHVRADPGKRLRERQVRLFEQRRSRASRQEEERQWIYCDSSQHLGASRVYAAVFVMHTSEVTYLMLFVT